MTRRVSYKGYIIEAHPHQLAEGGRWTLNITIERQEGDQVVERPFSAANLFDSEEDAVQHCINFGRQIIDGQVAGCTLRRPIPASSFSRRSALGVPPRLPPAAPRRTMTSR